MRLRLFLLAAFFSLISSANSATYGGMSANDSWPKCVNGDKDLLYAMKPGCKEWNVRAGLTYFTSYNQFGLRDHDYPPHAKPGVLRILLVGPSRLVAPGLDQAHVPARLYETELRKAGMKVEVINGAVEGYLGPQSAIQLRSLMSAYSPDVVVFVPFFQAVRDMTLATRVVSDENGFPLRVTPVIEYMNQLPGVLRARFMAKPNGIIALSTLMDLTQRLFYSWKCALAERLWHAGGKCLLQGTLSNILLMKNYVEAHNSRFIVAYDPSVPFGNIAMIMPQEDRELVARFEKITPEINSGSEAVGDFTAANGLKEARLSLSSASVIGNDHHYDLNGVRVFSHELAEKTLPFLRAK